MEELINLYLKFVIKNLFTNLEKFKNGFLHNKQAKIMRVYIRFINFKYIYIPRKIKIKAR